MSNENRLEAGKQYAFGFRIDVPELKGKEFHDDVTSDDLREIELDSLADMLDEIDAAGHKFIEVSATAYGEGILYVEFVCTPEEFAAFLDDNDVDGLDVMSIAADPTCGKQDVQSIDRLSDGGFAWSKESPFYMLNANETYSFRFERGIVRLIGGAESIRAELEFANTVLDAILTASVAAGITDKFEIEGFSLALDCTPTQLIALLNAIPQDALRETIEKGDGYGISTRVHGVDYFVDRVGNEGVALTAMVE